LSEEEQPATKAELLDGIRCQRQILEDLIAGLRPEQMVIGGVVGDWSVKDILAHIVAWEQRMVMWAGRYLAGESPLLPDGPEDVDRLNAEIYEQHKDRPLEQIVDRFRLSYPQALQVAEETSVDDLFDPERFAARGGQPLWIMVAANTVWHYQEHREEIEAWLAGGRAGHE
jgi:hypothetical protein